MFEMVVMDLKDGVYWKTYLNNEVITEKTLN